MILLDTKELYYNTARYFYRHIMDHLPNNDMAWREEYAKWLLNQGAVIVPHPNDTLIKTAFGVDPGYCKFGFENSSDAILFALRWS